MRIVLARHGDAQQTTGKFHGRTNDSLTSKGREESYKLAEELKQYNPKMIYYSPVKRCVQTAEILSNELDIPIEESDELTCMNMGHFVGKDIDSNLEKVRQYLLHPNQ